MLHTRLFIVLVLVAAWSGGCARPAAAPSRLYQTSTINALLEGVYDGDLTLAELREHGDFGLGTFNDIDGEMVLLAGRFYQVRSDGVAVEPPLSLRTPLAVTTFFRPQRTLHLPRELSYAQLQGQLDTLRKSPNAVYAFRVDGEFALVRTRSVPRQSPPYRRLVEVTREQPTFEFERVRGALVGFWVPQYLEQLNVPGYHLHFLTADRSAGGHVLECRPLRVTVRSAELRELTLRMPRTASFDAAPLGLDRRAELHQVEQATTQPAR